MARRCSPTQLPLGDVDMGTYGFGDEASRKDFMSGAAPDHADQPFCDSLTDYNWQSTDLEGLLREEAIYSTDGERQVPQLDEAMADTTLDILTDGPGAEAAPSAAEEPLRLPVPSHSQPASLPGTPSAAAAAAHASPAMSPCAPVTAAEVPLDSRDTSSQESNEPLRVAGGEGPSRKSRSAMSSRQSLAADAGDHQADTPRTARTQAHAMLDLQREQMEQERCQLQAQAAELQAKQMQLHRDYVALHMGPPDAPMLYPGQSLRAPDLSGKAQQLGPGNSTGDVLRSGSAAASAASGFSRDSSYSCQFRYSQPAQQQPFGHAMPGHGHPHGQLSGAPPPHMLGMAPPPMQQQQQQQQRPQDPQQSGSVLASPVESADHQQRQAQAMQQPGFVPGQRPHHPYGDPLLLVGWQPRPPSYYNPAGPLMPFLPGLGASAPAAQQAAPMTVDPPPSNEACMLGELKLLIDQLDQQTKATMKDSLYRISRHAQGACTPKVQQAAVAQGAGPRADSSTGDDISPVDRMVADLLYKDHAAQMPAFAASLAIQPLPPMQRQMPGTMCMVPQRPTASDQGSAAFAARHHGRDMVPSGVAPSDSAPM